MENPLLVTDNPRNFHEKIFNEKTGVVISVIALITLITGIFIFLIYGNWEKSELLDESKIGQFGDFIGGVVGSLVAFAGIVLYYVAITEQRKEIKINQDALNLQITALNHQIKEFQAQKEELISTRKIYEQQTKTMKNQQFDSNFYSILNVYIAIKNHFNENDDLHDFFNTIYEEMLLGVSKVDNDTFFDTNHKAIVNYTNIYLQHRGKLSSYFKTIYRLIKFIDDCDHLKEEEKVFYSKIIRSQLSDNELIILYYNYYSIYGSKAQPIVLKYKLLKHLPRLSKIEFKKHFDFEGHEKNKIIVFTEWIIDLIHNNIEKAKDIENTASIRVEELYKEYDIIIGIYIDVILDIRIIVKNAVIPHLPFEENAFFDFINFVLHDYYFFEKFKNADLDAIRASIIKVKETTTFNYIIESL